MAPPPKTTVRGTSPQERGVTRATTRPDPDPDRGVDLGGVWDENGNYWLTDEAGRVMLWQESAQQWQVIATPDQAVQMRGVAPMTDADRAYVANRDALLKRVYGAPAREFGRTGVMGGPGRVVGKMTAEALDKVGHVIPVEYVPFAGEMNQKSQEFLAAEAEMIADAKRRDAEAEAQTAKAHGELYQMPVVVASTPKLEKELEATVAAGTTKKVGSPIRAPARVEGFINDIAAEYREQILKAKTEEPKATASRHGILAEQRTLAKLPELAQARGLNPGHIMWGNVPVGVTGPRGGALSAEIGSPHYGFMIELKKSPKAVKGWQAQGHLIAVDHSLNYPWGGVYARIYGEKYKPGAEVDRRAMGGALGKKLPKPPKVRAPRTRLR
jgi:hypothetical protein